MYFANAGEDPKDIIARVADVLHYVEGSLIDGGVDLDERDIAGMIWTLGACRKTLETL